MKKFMAFSVVLLAISAFAGEPAPLRYHQVRFKASHNSYAKRETLTAQLTKFRFRSIELDLAIRRINSILPETAPKGDWFALHSYTDPYSNCLTLSACFDEVSAWHQTEPDHDVVTVFFDLKDGLDKKSGHASADLYAAFRAHLPPGSILEPGALLAACPGAKTLQQAVTNEGCAWPLLDDLKGKFILVIADGREVVGPGYDPASAPVFIAAKTTTAASIAAQPNYVFFNMRGPLAFVTEVKKAGLVARCYGLNDEASFLEAKRLGANHLAMDQIDPQKSPWAETDGENGETFEVIEPNP